MHTRKLIVSILIILIALPVMAAAGGGRSAEIAFGDTVTLANGRGGVFVSSSQYTGLLTVKRSGAGNAPGEERPVFVDRLVDIRLTDYNDISIKHIVGSVYVYFQVRQKDIKRFNNGEIGIFYFDPWKSNWESCDTFTVQNGPGNVTRVACRMRVFGLYGLGEK